MSPHARVCLYDAAPQKVGVLDARLRERGHKPKRVDLTDTSARQPKGLDLAVVLVDADSPVVENVPQLVDRLAESGTASIVWGTPPSGPRARSAMVEWLSPEIGLDELTGKVDTLEGVHFRAQKRVLNVCQDVFYFDRLFANISRFLTDFQL